jgi:hypothetical protein
MVSMPATITYYISIMQAMIDLWARVEYFLEKSEFFKNNYFD